MPHRPVQRDRSQHLRHVPFASGVREQLALQPCSALGMVLNGASLRSAPGSRSTERGSATLPPSGQSRVLDVSVKGLGNGISRARSSCQTSAMVSSDHSGWRISSYAALAGATHCWKPSGCAFSTVLPLRGPPDLLATSLPGYVAFLRPPPAERPPMRRPPQREWALGEDTASLPRRRGLVSHSSPALAWPSTIRADAAACRSRRTWGGGDQASTRSG